MLYVLCSHWWGEHSGGDLLGVFDTLELATDAANTHRVEVFNKLHPDPASLSLPDPIKLEDWQPDDIDDVPGKVYNRGDGRDQRGYYVQMIEPNKVNLVSSQLIGYERLQEQKKAMGMGW